MKANLLKVFGAVALGATLFSCSGDDEAAPVAADFEMTLVGDAPNAQLSLTNNSTGATTYEWSFSEGSNQEASAEESPSTLMVDKAGEFTVTLVAKNGTNVQTTTKTITIPGFSAIVEYTDIPFALTGSSTTIPRLFSTGLGESYLDSEIKAANAAGVDLAFSSMSGMVNYFWSPADGDKNNFKVEGGTQTKVINLVREELTIEEYNAMTTDEKLLPLVIENDEESYDPSKAESIVLFQNADGKKGAIKVKAMNTERILTDIKVQKY